MASTSNGFAPLEFNWNTGDATSLVSGLGAGSYVVEITDGWGCIGVATADLIDPPSMQLTGTITNVSCFEYSDGAVNVTVSGGSPLYIYNWNVPSSGSVIDRITSYTVCYTKLLRNNLHLQLYRLCRQCKQLELCLHNQQLLCASSTS